MAGFDSSRLKALLFDLDGTLVDTDHLHFAAHRKALAVYDLDIDQSYYAQHICGGRNEDIADKLLGQRPIDERREYVRQKEQIFRDSLNFLQPMPGLMKLLDWSEQSGLDLALVTSAPKENADLLLLRLRLQDRFPVMVLGEDIAESKPHPMPYITALERLNVSPDEAIAFEDSPPGISAVQGAGIYAVGVATSFSPDQLRHAGAQCVIEDFRAPQLGCLIGKIEPPESS